MDINQLSEIVKKKILDNELIENVELEDKSFLHKNHKTNNPNKFHIKLKIKSEKLKNMSRIESNKFIFRLLDKEMKNYIHSLQILFV
jgi:BolA protein|tara:strand:+ start:1239 stop:1499 length:261 start_codon:yes stop_codon:yes gene_type:complete